MFLIIGRTKYIHRLNYFSPLGFNLAKCLELACLSLRGLYIRFNINSINSLSYVSYGSASLRVADSTVFVLNGAGVGNEIGINSELERKSVHFD